MRLASYSQAMSNLNDKVNEIKPLFREEAPVLRAEPPKWDPQPHGLRAQLTSGLVGGCPQSPCHPGVERCLHLSRGLVVELFEHG
jgi:hypothetical protein